MFLRRADALGWRSLTGAKPKPRGSNPPQTIHCGGYSNVSASSASAALPTYRGSRSLPQDLKSCFGSDGNPPPWCDLKVSRAVGAIMPRIRASRFLVLESELALRAYALGLGMSGPTTQFDVADRSVRTKVPGDREVVHSANGG